MTTRMRPYSLIALSLVFLAGPALHAQAPLPPVEDRTASNRPPAEEKERLSREVRELGREYLELLHELQEVMRDYSRYMAEANGSVTAEQRKELAGLMKRLAQGAYLRSLSQLDTDLARTRSELEAQEAYLKAKNAKAYALTRNLQRSLEAINIQLESEIDARLEEEQDVSRELTILLRGAAEDGWADPDKLRQVYVSLVDDDGTMRIAIPEFNFNFSFDPENLAGLHELDSHVESLVITVPEIPETPDGGWYAPEPPAPPSIIIGGRNIVFTGRTGETQVVKEFADSLRVTRRHDPIRIDNPNGDLRLTGWGRNMILVRSEIGVGADSPDAAERLAEKVRLQVQSDADTYTVGYAVPALTDPHQQITGRYLEVMIPAGNPVSVSSSFGAISIAGLKNDLTVAGNNAPLEIVDVTGNVVVAASMAPVEMSEINGTVSVANHRAPVALRNCRGAISVVNQYAPVELDQCVGKASIRNSGQVSLGNHSGDATIENTNGLVSIANSEGDFHVTNAYQPLQIENVRGSVVARNNYAPIIISEMSGRIQARNTFAPIQLSDFTGPIELSNANGPILVYCTDEFAGPSVIQSTGGMINLSLPPDMDLMLTATMVNGDIQSTFPMRRSGSGDTRIAELALGNARPSLNITGTKSQVVVVEQE